MATLNPKLEGTAIKSVGYNDRKSEVHTHVYGLTLATIRYEHDARDISENMEFLAVVHSTNKSFRAAHEIIWVTVCSIGENPIL